VGNLYLDRESVSLAAATGADVSKAIIYENEAALGSMRTADYIDDNDPTNLEAAQRRGMKIIVYHGMQDPLIQFRNDIDFYIRAAAHSRGALRLPAPSCRFRRGAGPDFDKLHPWYRLFLVPNGSHCPPVPNALPALVDWVERVWHPIRWLSRQSVRQPRLVARLAAMVPPRARQAVVLVWVATGCGIWRSDDDHSAALSIPTESHL